MCAKMQSERERIRGWLGSGHFLQQPRPLLLLTDAESEAPILWPPDAKNRLIGKDPDAGKD